MNLQQTALFLGGLLFSLIIPLIVFKFAAEPNRTYKQVCAAVAFALLHGAAVVIAICVTAAGLLMACFGAAGGGAKAAPSLILFGAISAAVILVGFCLIVLVVQKHLLNLTYRSAWITVAVLAALVPVDCYILSGSAAYSDDGLRTGYLDTTGHFVIAPIYGSGDGFRKGVAYVSSYKTSNGPAYFYIDKSGKPASPSSDDLDERNQLLKKDEEAEQAFRDTVGTEGNGLRRGPFSEGLASASRLGEVGLTGYVDDRDKFVIEPHFAGARRFLQGLAAVKINEPPSAPLHPYGRVLWGFIDRHGKWVVKPEFFEVGSFHDGLARVTILVPGKGHSASDQTGEEERYGYVDKTGKLVVAPVLHQAEAFSEGLAPVTVDTKNWPTALPKYTGP